MTRRSTLAMLTMLAGGSLGSFRTRPAVVTVDVVVDRPRPEVDGSHVVPWAIVPGLTAGDFDVMSDGKACPVESVSAAPPPLSLAVLFDVSAGTEVMVDWLLDPVQDGLIPRLNAGDRVAFGRFGGGAFQVDQRFGSSPNELTEAALAALTLPPKTPERVVEASEGSVLPQVTHDPVLAVPGMNGALALGASPAWDAVDAAVNVLQSQPGRRAIVLVTDGRSTGNVHSLQEAIGRAQAAAVSVFIAGLGLDEVLLQGWLSEEQAWGKGTLTDRPRAVVRPSAPLESLAFATGGAYAPVFGPEKARPKRVDALANRPRQERDGGEPFHPANVDERGFKRWVGRMLATYVEELHAAYALRFSVPALDGRLHSLDVHARTPGLRVRAPQRYPARVRP